MPIVLIWDYLRDDTSLHFTVSLINQTACNAEMFVLYQPRTSSFKVHKKAFCDVPKPPKG